jgi:hypothetical protein
MQQYYTYIYNDLSKDEPFYVGKGHDNRAYIHLKKTKDNPHFKNRLAKMKRENNTPLIEIINTTNECAAFWLERCFIAAFGRRNLGTGTLLNMTEGGENPPLHSGENHPTKKESARAKLRAYNTPEVRARKAAQMKGKKNGLGHTQPDHVRKATSERTKIKNIGNKYAVGFKNSLGNRWVNNGFISKRIRKNESIPEGFILGRIMPWIKHDPETGRLV